MPDLTSLASPARSILQWIPRTTRDPSRLPGTITAFVLSLGMMLSACGGSTTAAPTPIAGAASSGAPTPTAARATVATPTSASAASADDSGCTLLTMADVSAALGEPVVVNNKFGCEFDSVAPHPFKVVRWIPRAAKADTFESESRRVAGDNGGTSSFAPVSGVGERAFSWHDDLGSARLDVLKGTQSVEIWVDLGVLGTADLDAKMKIAKQLAIVAANRL